jgi:hypothetical protein
VQVQDCLTRHVRRKRGRQVVRKCSGHTFHAPAPYLPTIFLDYSALFCDAGDTTQSRPGPNPAHGLNCLLVVPVNPFGPIVPNVSCCDIAHIYVLFY